MVAPSVPVRQLVHGTQKMPDSSPCLFAIAKEQDGLVARQWSRNSRRPRFTCILPSNVREEYYSLIKNIKDSWVHLNNDQATRKCGWSALEGIMVLSLYK